MNYIEARFILQPDNEACRDVLAAIAGDIGFESFIETDSGLNAYIQESLFDEAALEQLTQNFPLPHTTIEYKVAPAEYKNWNETWEQNIFQPIIIGNRCCIHSTQHHNIPDVMYDIVINPQMAFGTGYHETTQMLLTELMDADLKGKEVLDMGCGTCILGIMAAMRGAKHVTAIDIDEWSVNNSRQNIELNRIHNITVELGDARLLQEMNAFDVILANINRNILLADMKAYTDCMHQGSALYMSGFYTDDLPLIKQKAEELGLTFHRQLEMNNWAAVLFVKH